MKSERVCPHCGSADFLRARRRFYERLLRISKAYACQTCGKRFLEPGLKRTAVES